MSGVEPIKEHANRLAVEHETEDKQYVPEKYQLGIVTDFLSELGIDYATEQSIFNYPIDVLCANSEETMAIELKSRNIGKGIDQALRNADYVDFSFLAVWEEDVSETLIERVSDLPIGLLAVGESINIVSCPDKTGQQLYSNAKVNRLVDGNV